MEIFRTMKNSMFVIFTAIIVIIYSIAILRMYSNLKDKNRELAKLNKKIKENKDNLKLILNSTAEAIYGMDEEGNCTFCNASCLRMLGYNHYSELLGKKMHPHIHHSYKDGTPMPEEDCEIYRSLATGESTHSDEDVFWRADGTSFDVEYHSFPQIKNGKVIGSVVTFMDITERKKANEEIMYLSFHDALTGLYNRSFFNAELKRLDTERNLPISIILGDANGLKLTNDIFGHSSGDDLLIKIANAFKKVCREDDIIARIGGDEFVVLLPRTSNQDAEKIIKRINDEISNEKVMSIKASISLGCSTKTRPEQDIKSVMEDAENRMYEEKILTRKEYNSNQIKAIIESLYKKSPRAELHSKNVSRLSQEIGKAMNLTNEEIIRLKDIGLLHDIGKVALGETIINNIFSNEKDKNEHRQHSVIGFRILNSFDETLDLARFVLAHHEHWDGSGYPKGLKGNEIPLLSRIIAVAEAYDSMTNELNKEVLSKHEALQKIKELSGTKFDPNIVNTLINILENEN
jgi:diguanylate cyclase (GGDEF)-like protein/PAS domain S-box-containing protein/putative nucleotidyltransferase with HDIG domain